MVAALDDFAVFENHVGIRRDGTLVFSGDGSRTAELEKLQQAVRFVFRNNKKESNPKSLSSIIQTNFIALKPLF